MLASDRGSAPLEFLAFGIPGLLLCIVAFQLLWAAYLGNVSFDAASEGSMIAATADGDANSGVARANRVLASLAGLVDARVDGSEFQQGFGTVSEIRVELSSPLLGFGTVPVVMTARSVNEDRG